MKENLKPRVHKLWEQRSCDRVLFVERSGELRRLARLRTRGLEPKRNQVLIGQESVYADPKPGALPMSRVKMPEKALEDRTHSR